MSARPRVPKGQTAGGRFAVTSSNEPIVELSTQSDDNRLSADLVAMLPGDTAASWLTIAPLMPESAYLVGGTALAVHLLHRVSRDLDFFLERHEDLAALASALASAGNVVFDVRDATTINCQFNDTKVQILEATNQILVKPTSVLAGVRVASVKDIIATKLSVITQRGALRDYFDIMAIETQHQTSVEEGLSLAIRKYSPTTPGNFVVSVVKALGYLGDVADDPSLPISKPEIESYWLSRLRAINRNLAAFGVG